MFFFCFVCSYKSLELNNEPVISNLYFRINDTYIDELNLVIAIHKFYDHNIATVPLNSDQKEILKNMIKYGNSHLSINKKLQFRGLYTVLMDLLCYLIGNDCRYEENLFIVKSIIQQISYTPITSGISQMIDLLLEMHLLKNDFGITNIQSVFLIDIEEIPHGSDQEKIEIIDKILDTLFSKLKKCTTLKSFEKLKKALKPKAAKLSTRSQEIRQLFGILFKKKFLEFRNLYKKELITLQEEKKAIDTKAINNPLLQKVQDFIDKDQKKIINLVQTVNKNLLL